MPLASIYGGNIKFPYKIPLLEFFLKNTWMWTEEADVTKLMAVVGVIDK